MEDHSPETTIGGQLAPKAEFDIGNSGAGTVTIDWKNGNSQKITMTGNCTFAAPLNAKPGAVYRLRMIQDATGFRVPVWNSVFKFVGNLTPVFGGALAVDLLAFVPDGTNHWVATTSLASVLKLAAGLATAGCAPLKFATGPVLTTPEAGACEFLTNIFYQTPTAGNRGVSSIIHFTNNNADFTGTNGNAVQPIFQAANDRLTVDALTTYLFELFLSVTNGTTTATKGLSFNGGTCTFTSIRYFAIGQNAAINVTGTAASHAHVDTAASTVILATGTTSWWIYARGIMRINASGTMLPQFIFSAAPGTTVLIKKDSYMTLTPLGSNTAASVGAWA